MVVGLVFLLTTFFRLAAAETLTLPTVMRQAVRHSYTLKIGQSDLALRRLDLQQAQALYLPTLALRYDLGYLWALGDQQQVVTIGDSVSANDLSTWQNSLSLAGSLALSDFGSREKKLEQAGHAVRAAELAQAGQLRLVRQASIDAYVEGLCSQRRVQALLELVDLRKALFRALRRLQAAGIVGRSQLDNAALKLSTEVTKLDDGQIELVRALATVTELTGTNCENEETVFAPLPDLPVTANFPPLEVESLPETQALNEELARLRAERQATLRGMLPSINLYGNYRLYGADRQDLGRTLGDLRRRDATVALTLRWEFFSGFRDLLEVSRIEEQMHRVTLQKEQRIAELDKKIGTLQQTTILRRDGAGHLQQRRQNGAKVGTALARLRRQGLLDQPATLEGEIAVIEDLLDADLLQIKQRADAWRLWSWRQEAGL